MEARTLTAKNAAEIAEWCGGVVVNEIDALDPSKTQPGINLQCKQEVKRACVGNVILQHSDGSFEIR